MRRLVNTSLRILILICLVVAIAGSAASAINLPYNTTYGPGTGGRTFAVSGNVTLITAPGIHQNYYWYQYIVTFNASTNTSSLKNFSVNNMYRMEWIDAYTSQPTIWTTAMSYSPAQTSVTWTAPAGMPATSGQTVEFGYYSLCGVFGDVGSYGGGSNPGWTASGRTVGMVPEPGSLAVLGLGLAGFACRARVRHRRS